MTEEPPLTLAHISDPHFGTSDPSVTLALLTQLHTLRPDVIIITGDITQRARRSQFADARVFVDALAPMPVLVLPGNHDVPLFNPWQRLFHPYTHFDEAFENSEGFVFWIKGGCVLGVNSVDPLRHKNGQVDSERLLDTLPDQSTPAMTVVALHHPMDCRQRVDEPNLLINAEPVARVFSDARVDLVISGHIHDPWYSTSAVRYPDNPWFWVNAVAGTCISTRTRRDASNSFNLIRLYPQRTSRMELQRWDMRGGEFLSVAIHWYTRNATTGWHVVL